MKQEEAVCIRKKNTKKLKPYLPTLGPIADLEKHLPNDWWRHIFNSIYLKTDADVVENEKNTSNDIDLLLDITQITPASRILDLCCGQGRHALALASRGFRHIMGLDRSRYLIRLARQRAMQHFLEHIQFCEGDARKVSQKNNVFDLVMIMGNSFGYFEREEENIAVLREAWRMLDSGGTLLLDITDGEWMKQNFAPRSWEWIDQKMLVCRERELAADNSRLITREVVVDSQKGIIADQFYAERVYTKEEIGAVLQDAGFVDVKVHSSIQSESNRMAPDLGMMANRLIVTAKVKNKPVAYFSQNSANKLDCLVLMGDPRQPDRVKLHGKFNAEDFDTIDKLKTTLAALPGYKFNYLDNHVNLIAQLQKLSPKFVFNLCDEGFNNDPFKELHITAILDMLSIPYSGAGPICLGICYNKSLVTSWAKEMNIPAPDEIWIDDANFSAALPSDFPVLVKPAFGDSSIGITKDALIHNATELIHYFDKLRTELPGIPILVQEFLQGREFSVGLIGNADKMRILPILEVDYSLLPKGLPQILGYESKWEPSSPYWTQIRYKPATNLSEEVAREMIDYSMLLFQRLECKDYARFDFRMDHMGTPKLLEANPNPGWCWDGKFNLMASMANMSYSDFLVEILQAARTRLNI